MVGVGGLLRVEVVRVGEVWVIVVVIGFGCCEN